MVVDSVISKPNKEHHNIYFSNSLEVYSHANEFINIVRNFQKDNDLLITGVPGSGRYALVKRATEEIKARLIEIDCIKAASAIDFVDLFIKGIYKAFDKKYHSVISQKLNDFLKDKKIVTKCREGDDVSILQILPTIDDDMLWQMFKFVVLLPGEITKYTNERVVVLLKQISHIRFWDRRKNSKNEWEKFLRNKLNQDPKVSYVILETVAELEELNFDIEEKNGEYYKLFPDAPVEVIQLKPLLDAPLEFWIVNVLGESNLVISEEGIKEIISLVQGHIGSAESFVKRLKLICQPGTTISKDRVKNALNSILEDINVVFESLLLMLPASQLQLIECLAIEPTDKPHSKKYRDKHNLAKGGTLQGAIKGLQQKGLIYGAEDNFQLTLPLFAIWIKNNLI